MHYRHAFLFCGFFLWLVLGIASCSSQTNLSPSTLPKLSLGLGLETSTHVIPPVILTPTAPTVIGKRIIILNPGNVSPEVTKNISILTDLADQDGYTIEERNSITFADLTSTPPQMVAFFSPVENLSEMLNAFPQISFLAVGLSDLPSAPNLSILNGPSLQGEQINFLAGYIAAVITADWRVGVLSKGNSNGTQFFKRGVQYFCGLCRPSYPPFVQYPISAEISDLSNWQSALDSFVENGVITVYILPGAEDPEIIKGLAEKEIHIISVQPNPKGLEEYWAVTLQAEDAQKNLVQAWNALKSTSDPTPRSTHDLFQNVNADLFSPGKQRQAVKIVDLLRAGLIRVEP